MNPSKAILLLLALLLIGCGTQEKAADPFDEVGTGAAKLSVLLTNAQPQPARVQAVITAADIDTIRRDLTIGQDGIARGTITGIPVGLDRMVTLSAFSEQEVETHTGFSGGLIVTADDTLSVTISLLPIKGALDVVGVILADNDTARYRVTFDATWSALTHPLDFPAVPHFSGLIGVVHTPNVTFWQEGAIASDGIKNMAEKGWKVTLEEEFTIVRGNGNAGVRLSGGEVNPSPGSISLDFVVERRFPLVTLVCMIAPSPDWFVGVSGLSLLEDDEWVDSVTVKLLPYDAGTDGGANYSTPDQPLVPRQPISLLTQPPFLVEDTVPQMGTFTFTRF